MLKTNRKLILLQRATLFVLVVTFPPTFLVSARPKATKPMVIRPSNVLEYVADRLKTEPNIDPKELAAIGNKFIEKKGFDYAFDACDILDRNPHRKHVLFEQKEETWNYSMSLTRGKKIDLKIITPGAPEDGGMCAECFFWLPTRRVSDRQMLILAGDIEYRLNRPRSFILDQAWLMDSKMKKVLRTWELPYQMGPEGISADGTKLYYGFYSETLSRILVLELSEDGGTKFLARSEIDQQGEREFIEDYPKPANNHDVYFVRFRVAGKSYIVRYDSPCT